MRKNFVWCVALAAAFMACGRKKAASEAMYPDDSAFDSLFGTPGSLVYPEEEGDGDLPEQADELFDDFIFEFARLAKVQRERTRFPLPLVVQGDTTWVSEEKWKHEPLFKQQEYYTVFYNLEEQMELEKRTDLEAVDVDQIDLQKHEVKTCQFEREEGEWKLTEERVRSFSGDDPLDRFLLFYQRFVSDVAFQQQSVADTLRYVTTDPDDDFNTIEGTLDHDQWDAFKPQLPDGVITNIRYGQTYDNPDGMILVKAGISNGLMDILDFRKKDGEWKLVSYEN